ncbi:MAG: hypothetical protein K1W30_07590 [Lachnospiraceae bacterium]
MKKAFMTTVVLGVLMAGGIGSCQGNTASQSPEGYVDSIVGDIRTQTAEELRKVFEKEVSTFFESGDSEGQAKLEESVRAFIDQYSSDEEKLGEAKESLDALLQNVDGLSTEEIQDKIEGIFAE